MYSAGYVMVYRYNMRTIKRQMRSAIRTGDFDAEQQVQFRFDFSDPSSFKDVEVKDKGKEIKYKEEMYDVISVQLQGNHLIINCVADKDESKLVAGFAKTFDDPNSGLSTKKSIRLIKYSFPVFTVEEMVFEKPEPICDLLPRYKVYTALFTPQHHLNIPSPPPWQS